MIMIMINLEKKTLRALINPGLLLIGIIMALSGVTIQVKYHMGHHDVMNTTATALGIGYYNWSMIHKTAVLIFAVLASIHLSLHWKWFKIVMKRKLFSKNRQVLLLASIFFLVALTGFIPWLIRLAGGEEVTRKAFIEIHDKIALVLIVFLVLHVWRRWKRIFTGLLLPRFHASLPPCL
jgi:hypothetical protein